VHAIESGTIGRFDDMMKIRGNNVWPSAVDAAVFAHREIAEYTGTVSTDTEGRTECEVRIGLTETATLELTPDCGQLRVSVQNAIKESTNVLMTVVVVPRSELPEFTYKARRWKDQRQQGYRL
jgi:phenylacetate-CoA ligase